MSRFTEQRLEQAIIHDACMQLTTRYRRDIPELLKYNALCDQQSVG